VRLDVDVYLYSGLFANLALSELGRSCKAYLRIIKEDRFPNLVFWHTRLRPVYWAILYGERCRA
jgi:hypothetical protein